MTRNQQESPVLYHGSCLQEDIAMVPAGPGTFAVVLRNEFRVHSPYDDEEIFLPVGTPLLGKAQVDSLGHAVNRHLFGTIAESDLRLGVALLLGLEPVEGADHPQAAEIRADIDKWLGENTAFVFWPRPGSTAGVREDGFFAGVARSWALWSTASPPRHN